MSFCKFSTERSKKQYNAACFSSFQPRYAAFPTVTICNQNQYRKEYYQDHPEHQLLLRSTYPDFLDTFNKSDFNPDNPHYHLKFQNVTDIYVKAAHNIPERIIQCRWKLKEVNCSKYFHVVMTEFGVCHQFEYANLTVDNTGVGLYLILDVEQDSYMFGENYGVSGLKVVFPLYYNTIHCTSFKCSLNI